jgi:hypothetical protein
LRVNPTDSSHIIHKRIFNRPINAGRPAAAIRSAPQLLKSAAIAPFRVETRNPGTAEPDHKPIYTGSTVVYQFEPIAAPAAVIAAMTGRAE